MIDKINNILQSEIKNPTIVEKFNRQHIFFDLKNLIKTNSTDEEIIDLYYCFSLYEKCLNLSRENSLNLAYSWIEKIEDIHKLISDDILPYLQILYKPTVAFYHFKRNEFEKTLNLLEEEIENVDIILSNQVSLSIEFKMEQLVNKYRVLFAQKKFSDAFTYAKKIIRFVLMNENFNDIPNGSIHLIKDETNKNYYNWVNFILNNLISKVINEPILSETEKENALMYIFNDVNTNDNESINLNYSLFAIQHINDNKKFYEYSVKAFEQIYKLPIFVQYVLILKIMKENDAYDNLYENYIQNNLKLKILN